MRQWERRLKDLSRLLKNCEATYFDPELFRMNTNQFLQTARTVTFIIQKNKSSIPNFDNWYKTSVIDPWGADSRMKWAKDSRNTIEKVGDLELHSSLSAILILSYFEETDIQIDVGCEELLGANINSLIRFVNKHLAPRDSEGASIRIERRWVANSLPGWELLTALAYVYGRVREVCAKLARHLGSVLYSEIPDTSEFDSINSDARGIRYVQVHGRHVGRMVSVHKSFDRNFKPTPELENFKMTRQSMTPPTSFEELMDFHESIAKLVFETHGNHLPMLFMYGENWELLDYISTAFEDRSDKYVFWRSVAERVLIVKPRAIIWVSEAWTRDGTKMTQQSISKLPIIGEELHLIGITAGNDLQTCSWEIERNNGTGDPMLGIPIKKAGSTDDGLPNFFVPIARSFEKISTGIIV